MCQTSHRRVPYSLVLVRRAEAGIATGKAAQGGNGMAKGAYTNCPGCRYAVRGSVQQCPSCGVDIAWMLEERRLGKEFLGYLAVAVLGGALLSMVFLMSLGLAARFSGLLAPLWAALLILGGVLWLAANRVAPPS